MARIWLLLGEKAGDNAQVLRLAGALGMPFAVKRIILEPEFVTAKPKVTATLAHIDAAASDVLEPPWPDLVITIGRRMTMAALWVKERSGDRCKLVLIGAPKGEAAAFDLVIAPVQYQVGDHAHVCRVGLPLLAIEPQRLEEARRLWQPRFEGLKRPLTVLLVGGSMGTKPLNPRTALKWLGKIASESQNDGSLLISTSRRTPDDVAVALEAALPADGRLYRWKPGDPDNPYFGLVACGDRFVVTGDSISMLVEVARLGKPMAIAIDEDTPRSISGVLQRLGWRPPPRSRDFSVLHDYLISGGWAVELGEPFRTPPAPPPDDTAKAAAAVTALLS